MSNSTKRRRAASDKSEGSVRQYIEELRKSPSAETMISGMVKPAENDDGLMLAHAGDCERWAFIPTSAMQAVKSTGRVQCGAHYHTLAEFN